MKKSNLLSKVILGVLFAFITTTGFSQKPKLTISAPITADRFFDKDTIYNLKGYIYVVNNKTLTIEAGTLVTGDSATKGALIITQGSKIEAIGTACSPIVFTSSAKPKSRQRGDWGGLILLGYGAFNGTSGIYGYGYGNIEGITASDSTKFGGGANPILNDNSGTLKYVRIEFAGIPLIPNSEINGLTMGAVGSGTTIDYVQVSYSNDDSYEWFGGSVNAKHLIAFRGLDDDFDTDNGYNGKLQYGMGLRDPLVADVSTSNGFESDNNATGTTATPKTKAIFSNFTVTAGSDSATNSLMGRGAHIRRNSNQFILNSIIMGYPQSGVFIDGTLGNNTLLNVQADTMVKNNIIAAKATSKWLRFAQATPNQPLATLDSNLLIADNQFFNGNAQVKLKLPYSLTKPNNQLLAGSPAIGAAQFTAPELQDPFFDKVTYVGGFSNKSSGNWTKTWSNWSPTSTDYANGVPLGAGCPVPPTAAKQVSVAEVVSVIKVSATPNPSSGSFTLNVSGLSAEKAVLRITNLNTGALVYTGTVSNGIKALNLTTGAGLYIATVIDGKQNVSTRINIIK